MDGSIGRFWENILQFISCRVSPGAIIALADPQTDRRAPSVYPHYLQISPTCRSTYRIAKRERAVVYRLSDCPAQRVRLLLQFFGISPRFSLCCSRGPRTPTFPMDCLGLGRSTRSLAVTCFTSSECISYLSYGLIFTRPLLDQQGPTEQLAEHTLYVSRQPCHDR